MGPDDADALLKHAHNHLARGGERIGRPTSFNRLPERCMHEIALFRVPSGSIITRQLSVPSGSMGLCKLWLRRGRDAEESRPFMILGLMMQSRDAEESRPCIIRPRIIREKSGPLFSLMMHHKAQNKSRE